MQRTEYEPRRPSYQELLAAYDRARESYEREPSPRSFAVLETGLQLLWKKRATFLLLPHSTDIK